MGEGVGRQPGDNYSFPVNRGYVIVPPDQDRAAFITNCYRNERISLLVEEGGGVVHNCYIDKASIQLIEFPLSYNQLGSQVIFVTEPFTDFPIVIAVVSKENETQLLTENIFRWRRRSGFNFVEVEGQGQGGNLFVTVQSDSEGIIRFSLMGKNSLFEIRSLGSVLMHSDKAYSIDSNDQISLSVYDELNDKYRSITLNKDQFEYSDDYDNSITITNDGTIIVKPDNTFKLFTGGQPMALGDELVTKLGDVIDKLSSVISTLQTYATTQIAITSTGPMAILAPGYVALQTSLITLPVEIELLKSQLTEIKSTKAFLD